MLLTFTMLTCTQKKAGSGIIIAGSTSVQPFIEQVADNYMREHPGIAIIVQGGGSTAGIQATFNRICNIGTSSRHLIGDEKRLKQILIAMDGVAVIVHPSNPVDNLTVEQIRGIFTGKIRNWKDVGGKDEIIIPVTREEGSGTRGSFEELIMEGEEISDRCLVQDSNGSVREIIATTPNGIGYISAGLVDEREKAIAIDGIKPTPENLISHHYKFCRPFLLLLLEEPKGEVKKFIDYVLSPKGQKILAGNGLIPAVPFNNER